MNKDLRYTRTENAIKSSFVALIKTKNIEKITIKELCSIAAISRKTFYDHYLDIYDLADKISILVLDEMNPNASGKYDFNQVIEGMMLFMKENLTITEKAVLPENTNYFFGNILYLIYNNTVTKPGLLNISEEEGTYIMQFMIAGMQGIYKYWFETGCKLPIDDLVKIVRENITIVFQRYLE